MKRFSNSALILSIGFILSSAILSMTLYKIKAFDNALQVVGSAKQHVTSDSVHWRLELTRPVTLASVKSGNQSIQDDLKKVVGFFVQNGVSENALIVSPVMMNTVYENNSNGAPAKYILRQTIELDSRQIMKITALTQRYQVLIDQGVILQASSPEYYYSKLPELRVTLLKGAMDDAIKRAESMAHSNGQKVGPLKAASAGVVQVLSMNATNVSDYGTYDTNQIEKDVMVSVRATFVLK